MFQFRKLLPLSTVFISGCAATIINYNNTTHRHHKFHDQFTDSKLRLYQLYKERDTASHHWKIMNNRHEYLTFTQIQNIFNYLKQTTTCTNEQLYRCACRRIRTKLRSKEYSTYDLMKFIIDNNIGFHYYFVKYMNDLKLLNDVLLKIRDRTLIVPYKNGYYPITDEDKYKEYITRLFDLLEKYMNQRDIKSIILMYIICNTEMIYMSSKFKSEILNLMAESPFELQSQYTEFITQYTELMKQHDKQMYERLISDKCTTNAKVIDNPQTIFLESKAISQI
ncbi:MAG: hypothetical protein Gaeavirus6_2 [Gaeavirus sp.]|uniref:Lipoprotein n=1 Tax=Gaeavirus sp. TaxID=2487767 RepID=A0A3G4ZYN7_9VIRU|nr:MAG: hypothetical protein Gaeavirus6_2 [Gaeavirus sp.]